MLQQYKHAIGMDGYGSVGIWGALHPKMEISGVCGALWTDMVYRRAVAGAVACR